MLDNELGLPMELGKIRAGDCGDGEYWNGSRSGKFILIPCLHSKRKE